MRSERLIRALRLAIPPLNVVLLVGWFALFRLNGQKEDNIADAITGALAFMSFLVVGSLIIAHQRRNIVGWICTIVGSGFIYLNFSQQYTIYAYTTNPGGLPLRELVAWTTMFAWIAPVVLPLTLLLLLFPDGKPKSSRWRLVARFNVALIAAFIVQSSILDAEIDAVDGAINPMAIPALNPILVPLTSILEPALLLTFLACAASAVMRFRSATGVERLQMKWFAYAVGATLLLLLANDLLAGESSNVFFNLALGLLAVSIGMSVLRYRLYDIDRLINRTLVYGALTACLATTYFGLVVGLQEVLRSFSGGSDLAVVVTTLVVAALFLPARRRIQETVDRRFNRRAYDAARTVDAFSARLREQIDLDTLRYELLAVVDETMAPVQAVIWLRAPEASR